MTVSIRMKNIGAVEILSGFEIISESKEGLLIFDNGKR
jgi:hypothetical protein